MHFRSHTRVLPFASENSWKKLANDNFFSITKGSIPHIKHMYIQSFSMEVDWPQIWYLMKVSNMLYICTYYIFTLWGSIPHLNTVYECNDMSLLADSICLYILLKCKYIFLDKDVYPSTKSCMHREDTIYSHNALIPIGYFVQVVIWVVSDKTNQKCKIGTSDNYGVFHH